MDLYLALGSHYDLLASVLVVAESEEAAIEKAVELARAQNFTSFLDPRQWTTGTVQEALTRKILPMDGAAVAELYSGPHNIIRVH